jgi:Zn-finger nucleic acid-binding protein
MMFLGSKFCPHCGAAGARDSETEAAGKNCPRCKQEFHSVSIGASTVLECSKCSGLWLDTATFEKICNDREQQAAVLGAASLAQGGSAVTLAKVNYVPCPVCSQLMNRANFARCSGVIIDLCKPHGIWFDRDELSRIIQFISGGGLDVSRAREKAALEEERRRVRDEQRTASSGFEDPDGDRITGIASAGGLLKLLLG